MNNYHKFEGDTLPQRMAIGVAWLGGAKVIIQAISWLTTLYVARLLAPSDYGLIGMTWLFIGFLKLFNELGIGSAIIQKKTLDENELHVIFWFILITNIVLFLICILFSSSVSIFFEEPELKHIINVSSVIILVNGFGIISQNMLNRNMSFNKRAQAELFGTLLGSISTLIFATKGFGVWSLVYGNIIMEVINNLLYFYFYPLRPALYFSFVKVREIVLFGMHMLFARILWYFTSKADVLVAGKILGKMELGYYSLAFQFAAIPIDKITAIVTQVALPAYSKIQEDDEKLKSYFQKTIGVISCIVFPIYVGIIIFADDLVVILLTEKWIPMIFPLKILCIVSCIRAIESLNSTIVVAKGQPKLLVMFNVLGAIILPISFFIGGMHGVNGLAISWLIGFPLIFLYTTYKTTKIINMSFMEYFIGVRHYLISTIIMAILVLHVKSHLLIDMPPLAKIVITVTIGILFYIIYHILFNRASLNELKNTILKR